MEDITMIVTTEPIIMVSIVPTVASTVNLEINTNSQIIVSYSLEAQSVTPDELNAIAAAMAIALG